MRGMLRWWGFIFIMVFVAACGGTEQPLPTEIPSMTPVPPTATITPTRTPLPTLTPTIPAPQTNADDPSQQAFVRFVHAAPQLQTIDFYVDNLAYASFMEFKNYTDQGGLVAGNYTISAIGNGNTDLETALVTAPLTLVGGDSVIIVLTGTLEDAQLTVLEEDLSPVNGDVSRVTLFNAFSEAPISLNNGTTVINNDTGYGAFSPATIIEATELDFNVRSDGQIVYADKFDLRVRQNATFIVVPDFDNGSEPTIITLYTPILGIGNLIIVGFVDGLAVDVVANEQVIGAEVGYGIITEPQEIRATDYELSIYAANVDRATVDPVYLGNLGVEPNSTTYLIVLGTPENIRVLTHVLNTEPTTIGNARMTFVNALPAFQRVQVESNVILSEVIAFGQIQEDIEVPAGPLPLTWYQYQNGDVIGEALERQTNFAVLEGTDTLYFLTGRTDEPFAITNTVGTQAAAIDPQNPEPTPLPELPPTIYGLNALDGLSLQFFVDDVPLGVPVNPRSSNSGVILTAGEHIFTITRPDTGELLARLITTLEINKEYVVVAHGRIETGYQLLLTSSDPIANPDNNPILRLINVSENNTTFGVAVVVNNGGTFPFPDLNAEVDPNTGTVPFRISYPIGLTRVTENITSNTSSAYSPVIFGASVVDVYVTDDQEATVAVILPAIGLEAGRRYDIVAYQSPFTEQVFAFVIPYTTP